MESDNGRTKQYSHWWGKTYSKVGEIHTVSGRNLLVRDKLCPYWPAVLIFQGLVYLSSNFCYKPDH